jgi:hypothetical protein
VFEGGYSSYDSSSNLYVSHKSGVEQFLADKGWLSDAPLSQWHSISVDDTTGCVTRIDMRDMGLAGTIPSELSNMTHVEFIDFRNNKEMDFIKGTPMDEIGEPIYHNRTQVQTLLEFIHMSDRQQRAYVTMILPPISMLVIKAELNNS